VLKYDIENIGKDHPALLTGNFEACAVALCSGGASPWPLEIEWHDLTKRPAGTVGPETCELTWQASSKTCADKARKTYQPKRLTEDAAIGVCAVAFTALKEGTIDEVTAHGTGVDYWVDDQRAVLEISGIEKGDDAELKKRHKDRTSQLKGGSLFKKIKSGYVFVVAFGRKKAIFSYYNK
jgi:hypothetical protein